MLRLANESEFVYSNLYTADNKSRFVSKVKRVYLLLMEDKYALPSTEEIYSIIDNENDYILTSIEDIEYIYDFYFNNCSKKLEFQIETVLNELGLPHSLKKEASFMVKLFEDEELYKEEYIIKWR